jgi:hypothetical protein
MSQKTELEKQKDTAADALAKADEWILLVQAEGDTVDVFGSVKNNNAKLVFLADLIKKIMDVVHKTVVVKRRTIREGGEN